jgi:hypothetical protein
LPHGTAIYSEAPRILRSCSALNEHYSRFLCARLVEQVEAVTRVSHLGP